MISSSGAEILSQLADLICKVERRHPIRIAVDGVDAAGKTFLADALAPVIEKHGRPVIRASVDGFHNPKKVRYQRGLDSPEGYYRDSFNYDAIKRELLVPLGPGGDRRYRWRVFNLQEDKPVHEAWHVAPENAILLFDGVFLLRSELIQYWDFSIFLDVDFCVSVPRAVLRDVSGSYRGQDTKSRRAQYERRYVPGQKLYLNEARPKERASIIVNYDDFRNPSLILK